MRRRRLCSTLAGNACELVTVTSFDSHESDAAAVPLAQRRGVVVTARVHPGEPQASWMMQGLLDFLTGPSLAAKQARRRAAARAALAASARPPVPSAHARIALVPLSSPRPRRHRSCATTSSSRSSPCSTRTASWWATSASTSREPTSTAAGTSPRRHGPSQPAADSSPPPPDLHVPLTPRPRRCSTPPCTRPRA